MAKSNYLENKVIDHFLGTSSTSAPSNVYMGLFTSNPTDANSGTELTIGSNGYTRQVITFNAASSGSATNSSAETFTASGGNWGTITHFGIFDASIIIWSTKLRAAFSGSEKASWLSES